MASELFTLLLLPPLLLLLFFLWWFIMSHVRMMVLECYRAFTYHHLIDGFDDVVHFRASYEAIVVDIVEFKSPCPKQRKKHIRIYLRWS